MKTIYKKFLTLTLAAVMLFIFSACSDDNNSNNPPASEETVELIKYLEQEITPSPLLNYIPFAMETDAVFAEIEKENDTWTIIDLRKESDYKDGHIKGAVNVSLENLLSYYKTSELEKQDKVVLVSYTGQLSAYAASALRIMNYTNVYSMTWGMSAWNESLDKWTANVGNGGEDIFETTKHSKPGETAYPDLSTGKTTGAEIAAARVSEILSAGFDQAKIEPNDIILNYDKYFVICFWPGTRYDDPGHIKGAYNYQPKILKDCELLSTEFLNTLPNDKTIAIYSYTGEKTAFLAAYLRILGYDAKTVLFGANALIYDKIRAKGWKNWSKVNNGRNYELVK